MLTDVTEAETLVGDGNPLYTLIGFYRAFNARDLEGLVANWAEDDLPSMVNPISGIRRGWAATCEGYSKLFNLPASVRVAFHDFTSQGGSDWHLFVGARSICSLGAIGASGPLPACDLRRAARQTGIADQAIMDLSLYRGAQSHA